MIGQSELRPASSPSRPPMTSSPALRSATPDSRSLDRSSGSRPFPDPGGSKGRHRRASGRRVFSLSGSEARWEEPWSCAGLVIG